MTARAPRQQKLQSLQASFAAFNQISRDLESAYDRLRDQASQVDVALAESNRRLAEKVDELDRVRSHLEAVLTSLRDGVVVTDRDGDITLVNPAFCALAGRTAEQLIGSRKHDLRDEDSRPLCAGEDGDELPRAYGSDDGPRLIRSSRAPVANASGELLGEVETLSDETETEELRNELRRQETFSALGEMAAGVAHELRNPLAAVESFTHLLVRAVDQENDPTAHAHKLIRAARKANSIITNLLCFARPERFRPRPQRLGRLFDAIRKAYADTLPVVLVRPPDPVDLRVVGELALLERVLVNLIENARAATGEDGHIVVTAESWGERIRIRVEDDGPGIPEGLRAKLFLPFVTGRADGTGLGLSIVQRIVDLHHGRIDAHPRSGGGTVFLVELTAHRSRGAEQELPA